MTNKKSKLTRTALYLRTNESLFQCPICHASMKVHALKSLTCSRNHSFDIAKQGYLHLLTRQIPTNYTKELFTARRQVITESGFFDSLHQEITDVMHEFMEPKKHIRMIDMGSGEGSHVHLLANELQSRFHTIITGMGMDIAKGGILAAAKTYEEQMNVVADIANPPFADQTFDVMLNILSPANYESFHRILTDDGILVKVVPGEAYLQELRQFFYSESKHQSYSNEKIVSHFKENFQLMKHAPSRDIRILDKACLKSLLQMTPLTWNMPDEKIHSFLEADRRHITVDLDILVGRKKMPQHRSIKLFT